MDLQILRGKLNSFDEQMTVLRQENEELSIENGALASALLTTETAVLQRLVVGKALVAPAKTQAVLVPSYESSDSQQQAHHRSSSSSSSARTGEDDDYLPTAQQQYQYQHQQREHKISAATRVLLELEELVKAAAERAKPQVELEAEFAKERRKHAMQVDEVRSTPFLLILLL